MGGPIAFENRSFVVFQELLEVGFVPKSDIKTLIEIAIPGFLSFVQVELPVGLGCEFSILGIGFGIEP